ncbi:MAG: PEGA domain-containing protein [Planctomycetota bacterium]|nr:MAG: PEGA domain-containing protein [Planctomycetota bacterium]
MRRLLGGWLLAGAALLLAPGCVSGEARFAQVEVESNPPSAEVWVGEEQRDSSPCTLLFSQPGEFQVYLKKPGYMTVMKRVTVVEREKEDRGEVLEALPDRMVVTLDPVDAAPVGGHSDTGASETPYYDE